MQFLSIPTNEHIFLPIYLIFFADIFNKILFIENINGIIFKKKTRNIAFLFVIFF